MKQNDPRQCSDIVKIMQSVASLTSDNAFMFYTIKWVGTCNTPRLLTKLGCREKPVFRVPHG
jgi:hypothetical protein